jgi:hypothetical protein
MKEYRNRLYSINGGDAKTEEELRVCEVGRGLMAYSME